jgi:hypothetical protein
MNTSLKKIFRLALLSLIVFVLLHFHFGLFNRFNIITAHWDKWTGHERIIIYGELAPDDNLKSDIAPRFGFNYERHEDCTVTIPFVSGVKDYNAVMASAISARLGDDWNKILEKEIARTK